MIRYETTVWREPTLDSALNIAIDKAQRVIGLWDRVDVAIHDEYEHTFRGTVDVGTVFDFTFWVDDRG